MTEETAIAALMGKADFDTKDKFVYLRNDYRDLPERQRNAVDYLKMNGWAIQLSWI